MHGRSIRRCLSCGTKTHRMHWDDKKCPVCEIESPYLESMHGALNPGQILRIKERVNITLDGIARNTKATENQTIEGQILRNERSF